MRKDAKLQRSKDGFDLWIFADLCDPYLWIFAIFAIFADLQTC